MTPNEKAERTLGKFLEELGPSKSVERFLRGYGNVRTRTAYAGHLVRYRRWLKSKGLNMTPDQMIQDNLQAVFESGSTDVMAKRKHTDLLDEYVNGFLLKEKDADSTRKVCVAAVKGFYIANDSALFGHWKTSDGKIETPPPPLHPEDIRKVLKAMTVRMRTPLVIAWQTGIEIHRILNTDWIQFTDRTSPAKVELYGRKKHRKQYSTFLGGDSVEHVKLLGPKGMPGYNSVARNFRGVAQKLAREGLLTNPDPRSYFPHALRHSFETEASHAGVKAEIRDFFLGHLKGIQWTYNHRDEIHPEDLEGEYRRIEPYVSLDFNEATAKDEMKAREKVLQEKYEEVLRTVEALKAALETAGVLPLVSQTVP